MNTFRDLVSVLRHDKDRRTMLSASFSLLVSCLYAVYNAALGIIDTSAWLITMAAYYLALAMMRTLALLNHRAPGKTGRLSDRSIMGLCAALLISLTIILGGFVHLALSEDHAVRHDDIAAITVATYTFFRLGVTIQKAVKAKTQKAGAFIVIRCCSYVDTALSMLTMQMMMLASFGGMENGNDILLNRLSGTAVCALAFALAISLLYRRGKVPKHQ